MNWLRKKLINWLKNENAVEESPFRVGTIGNQAVVKESAGLDSEPLRLHIYRANGGTIVETRTYDRRTDRANNQLHIIGHDQDLGQSLSKIITMESLRG